MIIPVPWSSLEPDFTSIETTAGITLSTSCGMVTLPLSTAAPGAAALSWMVTPDVLSLWLFGDGGHPCADGPSDERRHGRHRQPGPEPARRPGRTCATGQRRSGPDRAEGGRRTGRWPARQESAACRSRQGAPRRVEAGRRGWRLRSLQRPTCARRRRRGRRAPGGLLHGARALGVASGGGPAAGSASGCPVSSLMWILLKGHGPPHRFTVGVARPGGSRTPADVTSMLRDADTGPASGDRARRASVSAACHAGSTLS